MQRRVEREFGVPFAGEILDPSAWTQTALKAYPADAALTGHLFGTDGRSSWTWAVERPL